MTDTIESTAVEEPTASASPVRAPEPAAAAGSTAVTVRERRSEVIRPLDPDSLVQAFAAYQQLLPRLLTNDDYQDAGRGKRFVTKSGWRKIAAAFDLDVQILRTTVDRDFAGVPQRAEVWARAISPSGRAMDGDGYCDITEERFSGPNGNQSKIENDLRATATTRAMNRAISGLVGMGDDGDAPPAGATSPPASAELAEVARNALGYLLDGDASGTDACLALLLEQFDGILPAVAGQTITIVAKAVKDHREALATAGAAA